MPKDYGERMLELKPWMFIDVSMWGKQNGLENGPWGATELPWRENSSCLVVFRWYALKACIHPCVVIGIQSRHCKILESRQELLVRNETLAIFKTHTTVNFTERRGPFLFIVGPTYNDARRAGSKLNRIYKRRTAYLKKSSAPIKCGRQQHFLA